MLQLVETDLIIHVGEQQRRHMGEGGQPSHHSHNGLTSSPSTLHHLDGLQVDSELQRRPLEGIPSLDLQTDRGVRS